MTRGAQASCPNNGRSSNGWVGLAVEYIRLEGAIIAPHKPGHTARALSHASASGWGAALALLPSQQEDFSCSVALWTLRADLAPALCCSSQGDGSTVTPRVEGLDFTPGAPRER